jgi:DNA repair protein RecN (Recombination protein N)
LISHLKLQDLILIEKADIEFGDGLNIFTGETGSGKSAILTAIRLIAGERADSEWIRSGASIGIAEAKLRAFPKELCSEIDLPPLGDSLTIRREIHRSGKSRCFIEDCLVNASLLRSVMRPFLEMVDQGSSHELSSPEKQREILDLYGGLEQETKMLEEAFTEMTLTKKESESAASLGLNRARDLEWAEASLKEIEEVNWQKEEEESLTQAHLFLTHTQELTEKMAGALDGLSNLMPHIRRIAHTLEGAVPLDLQLGPSAGTLKTAALELNEAEHFLRSYVSRLEADPRRLAAIESRIGAIEHLKRSYGPTWEEVQKKKAQFTAEIDRLSSLDDLWAALALKLEKLEKETFAAAKRLSEKRQIAAKKLSHAVSNELKCLNLPHAEFEIEIATKPLSSNGIDEIRFLFAANPGVAPLPLEKTASGGEISRLLFATKVVLAEKDSVQCLIFDEIDSNVGGQTAAVLGEKLKKLSKTRQVICVTHFVQVARFAMHHFAVAKQERTDRAATFVKKLEPHQREQEFARMVGN